MGSPYLEHSSGRTSDFRQSIHCCEDTVHRERNVRENGTIAVLPMAHQRRG